MGVIFSLNLKKLILSQFLPESLKTRYSPTTSFRSRFYVVLTSCKKTENFQTLIFHKTWKSSFWTHFGPFWHKDPRTRFFSKNPTLSLFKLHLTLISSKKQRIYTRGFGENVHENVHATSTQRFSRARNYVHRKSIKALLSSIHLR